MSSSDLSFTLSVLIPVLFIVVIEVAGTARSIELRVNSQQDPSYRHKVEQVFNDGMTFLPKIRRGQQIPTFSYFGTLHAVNVTILMYGIAIVNYGLKGAGRFILTIAVLIMLSLLPHLEIEEYREMREKSIEPISHKIHALGSFFVESFAGGLGEAYASGVPLWLVLLFGGIFVLAPIAVIVSYFSVFLERELHRTIPGR